jgi:hypothetical protein
MPKKKEQNMVAQPSRKRVPANTSPEVNEKIQHQIDLSVAFHREHPDQIGRRLQELDREWDIERALQATSSGITLFSLLKAILGARRYLLLGMVVQGFFMQHTIQGYCPPLVLFRKLGLRTRDEIELERIALKELRGDFGQIEDKQELDLNKLRGALDK